MDGDALKQRLRVAAHDFGFARLGVAPATPLFEAGRTLATWLDAGLHGDMHYMAAQPRADVRDLMPEAESVIVAAMPYGRGSAAASSSAAGTATRADAPTIARYAHSRDYHTVLWEGLRRILDLCEDLAGRPLRARICVDTSPLLERALAARAGIAFIGKSTMAVSPGLGTYSLLGEILTDLPLPPDTPLDGHCGECTRCLVACPTQALLEPYRLDARRCIAYLTIEHKGGIARPLRPLIGERVFGCDVCQEVCPFNAGRGAATTAAPLGPLPRLEDLDPVAILGLGAARHRKLVRDTALRRLTQHQLARNAAVALGNSGAAVAIPPLAAALAQHASAMVRGHAAWALGTIGGPAAEAALKTARAAETDASVLEEVASALATATAGAARPPEPGEAGERQ